MALAAAILTLALQPAITAPPAPCRSDVCQRRVARRFTRRRWRQATRPYRPWLERTRWCESRGHGGYRANTGNGYFGAYQVLLSTWRAVGGDGLPHRAEPLEQDYRAVLILRLQGRQAWPNCG